MLKIIRDNQKKILAVFGAGLMVVFIIQLAPQGSSFSGASPTAGTVNGVKVTQAQIASAQREWKMLRTLIFTDPNNPQATPQPLVDVLLRQSVTQEINQNSTTFFLLLEEARRAGITIPMEEVQSFVTSNIQDAPAQGTDEYEGVALAVRDCLMIEKLMQRAGDVIKISRPVQNWTLATNEQMISLKVVPLLANTYMSQVKAPTLLDIQNQYDTYADQTPALAGQTPPQFGQEKNPLGFGYKVPNRVQVQFIGIDYAEARRAAIASKSETDWYVDAYTAFTNQRDKYDQEPVSLPATRPATTQRSNATTLASAATEPSEAPAVHKLDNLQDDFTLHAQLVLKDLYDRETDSLEENAVKFISNKMNSAFGSYRDLQKAGTGKSNAAADKFVSEQFMTDLCDSIQTDKQFFGLKPVNGDIKQFKTEQELGQLSGIGSARAEIPGTDRAVPFAQYATLLYQPWISAGTKSAPAGALELASWQPSTPLVDAAQNVYIFRISGSDPAHTPPRDQVKDQVVSDWKQAQAYQLAQMAANSLLAIAREHGLSAAAAEAKLSVIATDPFDPNSILNGQADAQIDPLKLAVDSVRELTMDSLQLLTTAPGGNGRPQRASQLYADRAVALMELNQATPLWEPADKSIYLSRIVSESASQEAGPLYDQFCSYAAVAARMNFQPNAKYNQDQ